MSVKKVICEQCGQEISASNYSKHIRRHQDHPETFIIAKYKLEHDGLNCQFCNKECKNKNSLCNHERLCKNNPNKQIINAGASNNFVNYNKLIKAGGRAVWNKGLTKDTDERVKKQGESYSQHYHEGLIVLNNPMNDEKTRAKHKQKMKEVYSNKAPHSHSRSKHGWYKGIWCDSSWELAWVIYSLEHNIKFNRNTKGFKYIWEGEEHTYFPDFYLPNTNQYVEVKGYFSNRDKCKLEQFTEDYLLYDRKNIQYILEYVISKYGENFYTLYETKEDFL